MKEKELLEIIGDLEQYYECAGFADYYERVLKNMNEEELRKYHEETFKDYDFELNEWKAPADFYEV